MKKSTIIIIAVVVIAGLVYFYFMGGSGSTDDAALQTEQNPEVEIAAGRVLSLLNQIRSLQIDTDLFNNAAYRTLRDYSVAIPPQNVGRLNPFAPIPGAANRSAGGTRR
jgi:hypothetical protein